MLAHGSESLILLQNGVGEKIAKKIDEILNTEKLEKLEKVHSCQFQTFIVKL